MTDLGEELGRRKKASDIVTTMDSVMVRKGLDPFAAPVLEKLLARLPVMTADDWSDFYAKYMPGRRLKPPGDSLALILAHFRARLEDAIDRASAA